MTFKTNREVRLERILRAFVALDNGDEPYWWKVEHSALIADAKDELNAAPQAPAEMASGSLAENGAGQRFPVPHCEDATRTIDGQPAVAAHTVCTVCGGRAAACRVLGHRPLGDETKWY